MKSIFVRGFLSSSREQHTLMREDVFVHVYIIQIITFEFDSIHTWKIIFSDACNKNVFYKLVQDTNLLLSKRVPQHQRIKKYKKLHSAGLFSVSMHSAYGAHHIILLNNWKKKFDLPTPCWCIQKKNTKRDEDKIDEERRTERREKKFAYMETTTQTQKYRYHNDVCSHQSEMKWKIVNFNHFEWWYLIHMLALNAPYMGTHCVSGERSPSVSDAATKLHFHLQYPFYLFQSVVFF